MTETQPFQFGPMNTPSTNNLNTPSKRGHSHRRSFAVSGDFEFLKQPPNTIGGSSNVNSSSVPPLPRCASPDFNNSQNKSKFNSSDVSFAQSLTPRKIYNNISSPSPRFFISEEPKFTSPVKGVPDAIINLDDALKTKPKSFKSHRRSESAPADLEVAIDFKHTKSIPDFIIDEEDSIENQESDEDTDMVSGTNQTTFGLMSPLRPSSPAFRKNYQMNETSSSPTKLIFHQQSSGIYTNTAKTDQYNSLKIKRQKQRYYHYTKQLPTNNIAVNTQIHALQEKKSTASLVSATSRTPVTMVTTPSNTVNSPVTPLSNRDFNQISASSSTTNCNNNNNQDNNNSSSNNDNNFSGSSAGKSTATSSNVNTSGGSNTSVTNLYEQRRARSPDILTHQQNFQKYPNMNNQYPTNMMGSKFGRRNSGPTIQSSFKFKSKTYDMPINDQNNAIVTDDNANDIDGYSTTERSVTPTFIGKSNINPSNDKLQRPDFENLDKSTNSTNDPATLSMDILMGEPGDTVDLSENNSSEIIDGFQNISISSKDLIQNEYQKLSEMKNMSKKPSKITHEMKFKPEARSTSDSVVEIKGTNFHSNYTNSNSSSKNINNSPHGNVTGKKKRSKLSIFTNLFSK
ncbi:hypothetical protein C6P45_004811 [Maudiozyma exigua]|uniref:Uncharacterized protein n=1 Tax=Maudiozyma exigua TaxID=34358 RepID=A0A9P7BBB9_MAUEX|nr:hypothetical protein C6P45_004811 [Kazachstania exigua]